jgi:hypothetical protein
MRALCRVAVPVAAFLWLVGTSLIVLAPVSLYAHASLLRAEPAADTRLSQLPSEIRLWFSESIERRFSRITVHRVTRASGGALHLQERVDTGVSEGPQVAQELAVLLPTTLPPGLYLVQWKVLSIDAHRTTGRFTLMYDPQTAPARDTEQDRPTP